MGDITRRTLSYRIEFDTTELTNGLKSVEQALNTLNQSLNKTFSNLDQKKSSIKSFADAMGSTATELKNVASAANLESEAVEKSVSKKTKAAKVSKDLSDALKEEKSSYDGAKTAVISFSDAMERSLVVYDKTISKALALKRANELVAQSANNALRSVSGGYGGGGGGSASSNLLTAGARGIVPANVQNALQQIQSLVTQYTSWVKSVHVSDITQPMLGPGRSPLALLGPAGNAGGFGMSGGGSSSYSSRYSAPGGGGYSPYGSPGGWSYSGGGFPPFGGTPAAGGGGGGFGGGGTWSAASGGYGGGGSGWGAAFAGMAGGASNAARNVGALGTQLHMVNGLFDPLTRTIRSLKNDLLDLSRIFLMAFGAAAAAVVPPLAAFAEFEKQMLAYQNMSQSSAETTQQFGKSILDLSDNVGVMAKDLASASIAITKLGVDAKDTNLVLQRSSELALGQGLTTERAAEITLGVMGEFHKGMSEISKVQDILTRTSLASAGDMETLANTLKYVGPIAHSSSQSLEEVAAASIILSKNMILGSTQGTTLRTVIANLEKQTPAAAKAIEILGLQIFDSNGKMRPILTILHEMGQAMKGWSDQTKNATIATIFGKYALSGSTALINAHTDAIDKAREATENQAVSTKKMADGMRQGLAFAFQQAKVEATNAAIVFGEQLAPAAEDVLAAFKGFFTFIKETPKEILSQWAENLINALKVLLGLVGSGAIILAIRSIQGAFVSMTGIVIPAIMGMITALNNARVALFMLSAGMVSLGQVVGAGILATGPWIIAIEAVALAYMHLVTAINNAKEAANEQKVFENISALAKMKRDITAESQAETERLKSGRAPESEMTPEQLSRLGVGFKRQGQWQTASLYAQASTAARALPGLQKKADELKALMSTPGVDRESQAYKKAAKDLQGLNAEITKHNELLKNMNVLTEEQKTKIALEGQGRSAAEKQMIDLQNSQRNAEQERELRKKQAALTKAQDDQLAKDDAAIRRSFQERRSQAREQFIFEDQGRKIADTAIQFADTGKWKDVSYAATSTGENLLKVGAACARTVEEILGLAGASKDVLEILNDGAVSAEKLVQLGKATRITDLSKLKPGDILYKRGQHVGIYVGNGQVVEAATNRGEAGKDFSGFKQIVHHRQNWMTTRDVVGVRLNEGLVSGKMDINTDAINKQIQEQQIQAQISLREKLLQGGTLTPEMREKVEKQIEDLKAQMTKAGEDAAQAIFKSQEDTYNNLLKLSDQLKEQRLKIESDISSAVAEMDQKGFKNRLDLIKAQGEFEKQEAEKRFRDIPGGDQELNLANRLKRDQVREEIDAKTKAETILAITQEEARTKEAAWQAELAQAAKSRFDGEVKIMALDKERVGIENELASIKGREDVHSNNLRANLEKLLSINTQLTEEAKLQARLQQEDLLESGRRINFEFKQLDLQKQILSGQASQSDLESALNQERQRQLDQILNIKNQLDAKTMGSLVFQQKMNEYTEKELSLRQQIQAAYESSALGQYENSYNQREKGLISQEQFNQDELDYYNRVMKESTAGSDEFNAALQARNELLIKQGLLQGDLNKVFEAYLLKIGNAAVLDKVNLQFGTLSVNGQDLVRSMGPLNQAMQSFFGLINANQDSLGKMADTAGTMLHGIMAALSQNWITAIATAIKLIMDMGEAIKSIFTGGGQTESQKVQIANEIQDIKDASFLASVELAKLTGQISEMDAASLKGAQSLAAMARQMNALKTELSQLEGEQAQNSGPGLWSALGPIGMLIGAGVDAKRKQEIKDQIEKIKAEMEKLGAEMNVTTEEQTQQRIKQEADAWKQIWEMQQENTDKRISLFGTETQAIDNEIEKQKKTLSDKYLSMIATGQFTGDRLIQLDQAYWEQVDRLDQEGSQKKIDLARKTADELIDIIQSANIDSLKRGGDAEGLALAQAERKKTEAQRVLSEGIRNLKGNPLSSEYMAQAAMEYQKYANTILNINQDLVDTLAEMDAKNSARRRETEILAAKNLGEDVKATLLQYQDDIAKIDEDTLKEKKVNANQSVDIEKNAAEKKKALLRQYVDNAADAANKQYDLLKKLRTDQFDADRAQYDSAIQAQQDRLVFLKKERDDLQKQVEYYNNLIDSKLKQFNKEDKGIWENLLSGVNMPDEIRKGLELIANPEAVPNERFSVGKSWQRAIQERVDLLNMENESRHKLEEITDKQFYEQQANISLIQAKLSRELLNNPIYQQMTSQLTAREKQEILQKEADAYVTFQEAKQNAIKATYQTEQTALQDSIAANEDQQKAANNIIQENQYQIDLLKMKYDQDIRSIEKQVQLIEAAHRSWKVSIDDVRTSFSSLVSQVMTDYQKMVTTLSQPLPSIGGGKTATSGTSSIAADLTMIAKKDTGTGAPAGYPVQYGDYWFKDSSTAAQWGPKLTGMASGGIVPDLAQYANDGFGPVKLDRNEAVIPLDELWKQLGGAKGNSYYITVSGNTFKDEIDFEQVFQRVKAKFDSQDQIANGRYYLTLG